MNVFIQQYLDYQNKCPIKCHKSRENFFNLLVNFFRLHFLIDYLKKKRPQIRFTLSKATSKVKQQQIVFGCLLFFKWF